MLSKYLSCFFVEVIRGQRTVRRLCESCGSGMLIAQTKLLTVQTRQAFLLLHRHSSELSQVLIRSCFDLQKIPSSDMFLGLHLPNLPFMLPARQNFPLFCSEIPTAQLIWSYKSSHRRVKDVIQRQWPTAKYF